jgi:glucan phosphorylase
VTPETSTPDEPTARLRRQLEDLARNFRWVWDVPTQRLFARIAADGWEVGHRAPLQLLADVDAATWDELTDDETFRRDADHLHAELVAYVRHDRPARAPEVAYFSPEFGVAESLPQYSGGLGVLAGDHLKAASDLDLPLVGTPPSACAPARRACAFGRAGARASSLASGIHPPGRRSGSRPGD